MCCAGGNGSGQCLETSLGSVLGEVLGSLVLVQEVLQLGASVVVGLLAGISVIADGCQRVEGLGGFLLVDLEQGCALVATVHHEVAFTSVGELALDGVGSHVDALPTVLGHLRALDVLGNLLGGLATLQHSQRAVLSSLVARHHHQVVVHRVERHHFINKLIHLVLVVDDGVALGRANTCASNKVLDSLVGELIEGLHDSVNLHCAQDAHRVDASALLQSGPSIVGNLVGCGDVGLRRHDVQSDVVDIAVLLVEAIHGLVLLPLGLDFLVANGILGVVHACEVLLNESDVASCCLILGHLCAVQVISLQGTAHEHLQLGHLQLLDQLLLQLVPLVAHLDQLIGGSAELLRVGQDFIDLRGALGTHLLCKLLHHGSGVLTHHELGDLVVADLDAHLFVLLIEQGLIDHGVEHLLLAHCCVHLVLAVLVGCGLFLHAALEGHDVDFLTSHLCGGAVSGLTTECLDTYLNDESNKCGTDDDGENFLSLTDSF